ncbi:hypothetical protein ACE63J_000643 [Salmonella enterica subsp. enterica]|nr:hypothetical protein [Salmonella enterica subsp. enterica serovar Duesseldorf]ECG3587202.1 hypothetical protein [Salmonella enterica subsp. enterica serovar Duesseldorf]
MTTTNKPMTGAQLDELMAVAMRMQSDSEKMGERSVSMFAYAVQVAVLEIRETRCKYEELQSQNADMAVQLANAESKCRELAAEVQAVRWACGQVYMKGYNHGHLNTVDGLEYASDTELVERGGETLADFTDPDHCGIAADAILDEVRASGADEVSAICRGLANKDGCSVNMQCSYNLTAERAEAVAAQLRKGAAL